jgi:hypothetical protein
VDFNIAKGLRHTPKWAWYTTAGVGIAGGAIMLYNHRAVPDSEQVIGEDGEPIASDRYAGIPNNTPVITPPVIIGGNSEDTEPGIGQAVSLYMGGIQDLVTGWETLGTSVLGRDATLTDYIVGNSGQAWSALTELAIAGGPPKPAAAAPSPVNAVKKTMAQEAARMKLHGLGGGYWSNGKGKYYRWIKGKMVQVPATMGWEASRMKLHGIGGGYFKSKAGKCYKWGGGHMKAARCPKVVKPKSKPGSGKKPVRR